MLGTNKVVVVFHRKGCVLISVNFIPLASKLEQNGGNKKTEPTKEWSKRSKRSEITEISKGLYRNSIFNFMESDVGFNFNVKNYFVPCPMAWLEVPPSSLFQRV